MPSRIRLMMLIIVSLCLIGMPISDASASQRVPAPPTTRAESASLIDVNSGRIVYNKAGDKSMRIASLTKIMTAILAIENGKLTDIVTVSSNAAGKEGSSLYLKAGDKMSLGNMLYGLLLRSGNDAATAIAEHIGGSVEGFTYMMNEKASLIGMQNTKFINPSGLDENSKSNMSTANEMAKLSAYALKNADFKTIVKTKVKTVPKPDGSGKYVWKNKDRMLTLYEGADGVKTGYTKLAKRTLVSSATKGGQQFSAVTLNDSDDWVDHTNLLNYGFANFPLRTLISKGESVEGTPWVAGYTLLYAATREEVDAIQYEVTPFEMRSTEFKLGIRGTMQFRLEGKLIGSVTVYEPDSPRLIEGDRSDAQQFLMQEDREHSGFFHLMFSNWVQAVRSLLL
jgi:D-alanyl-D-alanine carboxypeptidase (penicillin-binding protein 5/6)